MDALRFDDHDGARHDVPGAGFAHPYVSFLGALTFMYISARAVDDAEYRAMFLDPLIDDLHTALLARNRYRNNVVTAPCAGVDAGHVDD